MQNEKNKQSGLADSRNSSITSSPPADESSRPEHERNAPLGHGTANSTLNGTINAAPVGTTADVFTRFFGQHGASVKLGWGSLRSGVGTLFKRFALHSAALIAALIIAEGSSYFLQVVLFYFGAICLLPRGFSPRKNNDLAAGISSLGQFVFTLLIGFSLPLSLFLAGAQSWLQRAFTRRFHLGLDWFQAPFLLGLFIHVWRYYNIPTGLYALTFACGLAACYTLNVLDERKRAALAAAEQQNLQPSPLGHFYNSSELLERKAANLPEKMQVQVLAIATHSRNILLAMQQEQVQQSFSGVQSGSRFLKRYLPAAHKIIDEYTRLSSEGQGHREIEAVLGRVDELFERLAQAFAQEHGSLLQNDAMSFSAELQVLDKLLKMDGK